MAAELVDIYYDLDRENPTGTALWKCGWGEASSIASEMVGGMLDGIWQPPQTFPISNLTGLLCNKVSVKKWGSGTWLPGGGFQDAELTATYGILKNIGGPSASSGIELAELSTTTSGEGLTLPKGAFTWTSGAQSGKALGDDDITPSLIMPFTEVALKIKYLQSDGLSTMAQLAGCVNQYTFSVLSLSAPQDCALFLGGNLSVSLTTMGTTQWQRDLKFGIRQNSWNKFLCTANSPPTWETISSPPFQEADLTALFS
jgi:hypothetical protein